MLPASGYDALGVNLVTAVERVLRAAGAEPRLTRKELSPQHVPHRTTKPATLREQIREVSALHADGLLTGKGFTETKKRLLEQL